MAATTIDQHQHHDHHHHQQHQQHHMDNNNCLLLTCLTTAITTATTTTTTTTNGTANTANNSSHSPNINNNNSATTTTTATNGHAQPLNVASDRLKRIATTVSRSNVTTADKVQMQQQQLQRQQQRQHMAIDAKQMHNTATAAKTMREISKTTTTIGAATKAKLFGTTTTTQQQTASASIASSPSSAAAATAIIAYVHRLSLSAATLCGLVTIKWILLCSFLATFDAGNGLSMTEVRIPKHIMRNEDATLGCKYDMDGESLYSVKWYKDGYEFYRFVPRDMPPGQVFPLPGVDVDLLNSTQYNVVLRNVTLESTGRYRCEVSGEAPSFQTVGGHEDMVVVVMPSHGPKITGGKPRYQINDFVRVNCTSAPSKPVCHLSWQINGMHPNRSFLRPYDIRIVGREGLEVASLGLEFRVRGRHFKHGDMKLKCVAKISSVYWQSNEESVESDKHQRIPVLESRETVVPKSRLLDKTLEDKQLKGASTSSGTSGAAATTAAAAITMRNSIHLLMSVLYAALPALLALLWCHSYRCLCRCSGCQHNANADTVNASARGGASVTATVSNNKISADVDDNGVENDDKQKNINNNNNNSNTDDDDAESSCHLLCTNKSNGKQQEQQHQRVASS